MTVSGYFTGGENLRGHIKILMPIKFSKRVSGAILFVRF